MLKRLCIGICALPLGVAWAQPCVIQNPGFEAESASWKFDCSRELGSTASIHVVQRDLGGHTHSGDYATQMMIQGDGTTGSVAWASVSQVIPCIPGKRMQVGYYAHPSLLLDSNLSSRLHLELRVEFFRDAQAERPIPTHATFRTPLTVSNPNPKSAWIPIVTSTRSPPAAACMKISVVFWALDPKPTPAVVWIDDLAMRITDTIME